MAALRPRAAAAVASADLRLAVRRGACRASAAAFRYYPCLQLQVLELAFAFPPGSFNSLDGVMKLKVVLVNWCLGSAGFVATLGAGAYERCVYIVCVLGAFGTWRY